MASIFFDDVRASDSNELAAILDEGFYNSNFLSSASPQDFRKIISESSPSQLFLRVARLADYPCTIGFYEASFFVKDPYFRTLYPYQTKLKTAELSSFCVKQDWRGAGVGRLMLQDFFMQMSNRSIQRIVAKTHYPQSLRMRKLLELNGFECASTTNVEHPTILGVDYLQFVFNETKKDNFNG